MADQAGKTWTNAPAPSEPARNVWTSIKRGLLCRCPHCGQGSLFTAYLKPVDHCAACGEDFTHQRADDLPAYLAILVVGHIVVGGFMMTDLVWPMSNAAQLAIWGPIAVILALGALQPMKGGVIGLQWAVRMHGFGGDGSKPEA
jgi:uncharacterized protein (DUF983 family)